MQPDIDPDNHIAIFNDDKGEFYFNNGGWKFSDPNASDYEVYVERFWGEKQINFTVYYNYKRVCGRVLPK